MSIPNWYMNVNHNSPQRRQPKYPSADEWTNRKGNDPYNGIVLAIKRKEVLTHTMMWMNLEYIMLSERSQIQKTAYCMISFT